MGQRVLQLIVGVIVGAAMAFAGVAIAQPQPPGRVARLNHTEGRMLLWPAGGNDWAEAELNRPLRPGDQLRADAGTRAEIEVGSATVRMDAGTQLKVLALGDDSTQLSLTQGSLRLRVRNLADGENFEIDTPNLAYRMAYPGEARIDVDGTGGSTRVTLLAGAGAVYGERGEVQALGGGQQMTLRGRSLEPVAERESPPQDNFDRWAAERERRDEQSQAARYLPREVIGYQWLDGNGQWAQDPAYGAVWFPNARSTEWAPYRQGRWTWIAPWGWTWIDEAPWAFAPSHYGRWAIVGARWAWVPGRLPPRPTYAPALVAFVKGAGAAPLTIGGKASVAWFPLAPGEPWTAGERVAARYTDAVNVNMRALPPSGHAYLRTPEAFTAVAADDFAAGKNLGSAGRLTLNAAQLASAQVTPVPNLPEPGADPAGAQAQPLRAPAQQATARPPSPKAVAPKTKTAEPRTASRAKPTQASRQAPTRSGAGAKRDAKAANASREQPARRAQPSRRSASAAKKPAQARSSAAPQRRAEQPQRLQRQQALLGDTSG